MDLRNYITDVSQVGRAKELVIRGLLQYQPYIFADDLEVGVGYEIINGEFTGMAYYPTIEPHKLNSPELNRIIFKGNKNNFSKCNKMLEAMYDHFINTICNKLGDITETTFADIGCNSGYFPLSFCLRGAKEAAGYDRENYTDTINLLNEILGTNVKFYNSAYDGNIQEIPDFPQYDTIISIAVLCHLSDPLQHLSFLGAVARKALFVYTPVTRENDYCIRFGEPNKYYKKDGFPFCFDNNVRLSAKLLRKCFELMGFAEIYEIPNAPEGFPDSVYNAHIALLGIR